MKIRIIVALSILWLSGCVSYSTVAPGDHDYSGLHLRTTQAWNQIPDTRSGTEIWTQDGILLDRLIIIPAVPDGETIFEADSAQRALPVFSADMLPNEIEEMTESSLVNIFPEGEVAVETANLRPHQFGDDNGVLFDLSVVLSDGPNYKGVAGAFVVNEQLNIILYLGADPFYYEKHLEEALVVIRGASA